MGHGHHEHDHEYMHEHNIPHSHDHEHHHDHEHCNHHDHDHHHCQHAEGGHCHENCAGCANVDPKAELAALMKYMVGHNTAHANELAQLAKKLHEMGDHVGFEQVMAAVSDFEKGNMRLSAVLAAMNMPR